MDRLWRKGWHSVETEQVGPEEALAAQDRADACQVVPAVP
jgi:hypothetical protein